MNCKNCKRAKLVSKNPNAKCFRHGLQNLIKLAVKQKRIAKLALK